jgi:type IV pilus assembly protein PilE
MDPNNQHTTMRPAHLGFTLIELLITVALVSILAAIALPSYQAHIRKSTRSEAQSFMMTVAARQQQFLVDTRAYAATVSAVGVAVPTKVAAAYTVNMPPPTATGFTLTLTPTGAQAQEPCGTLSINQAGTKTAAQSGCW